MPPPQSATRYLIPHLKSAAYVPEEVRQSADVLCGLVVRLEEGVALGIAASVYK